MFEHAYIGNSYTCTHCDFELCTGHDHHTNTILCVCSACGQFLRVQLNTSPSTGEEKEECELQIYSQQAQEWHGTGKRITAQYGKPIMVRLDDDERVEVASIETCHILCPCCRKKRTVVADLEEGQLCPKCKEGIITYQGYVVY